MNVYYITFRSVTVAQRGEVLFQKKGIPCSLQRTPRWMEEQGCGYCLRLRLAQIDGAAELLRHNHIGFRKIYVQNTDGSVEEISP